MATEPTQAQRELAEKEIDELGIFEAIEIMYGYKYELRKTPAEIRELLISERSRCLALEEENKGLKDKVWNEAIEALFQREFGRQPMSQSERNLYDPHQWMIDNGTFWRCDHGTTGINSDLVFIGCLPCADAMVQRQRRELSTAKDRIATLEGKAEEVIPWRKLLQFNDRATVEHVIGYLEFNCSTFASITHLKGER